MKKVLLTTILAPFLLSACAFLTRSTNIRETETPTPATIAIDDDIPCAPENWVIAVTSVEQTDLGDGTKLVFAKIGIENNDSLWGTLNGPDHSVAENSVFLTTEDGSIIEYLDSSHQVPSGQLSNANQILYGATGRIETPLLPPGFVALGKTTGGDPHYYNFAFRIPESQTPDIITIGGMSIDCIQPHVLGENGMPLYREKRVQLPAKTYDLDTDLAGVREAPSARRYPNLAGAELTTPDWKENLFITGASRNGNTIEVTFNFTNFSSRDMPPSFNGYIMGSNRLFICQNDCDEQPTHAPVEPGRTAQDLPWTFTVPEDETNLVFVYVYGGQVDLNEVRRINLE